MTNEEAIKKIKSLCHDCDEFPHCVNTDPDCFKALEMAIKVLSAEPCEDCISRQAVLALKTRVDTMTGWSGYMIDALDAEQLPSVQPKTDVLDKIRAEIHATAEMHEDGVYYLREEWIDEIIDKYKAESEE